MVTGKLIIIHISLFIWWRKETLISRPGDIVISTSYAASISAVLSLPVQQQNSIRRRLAKILSLVLIRWLDPIFGHVRLKLAVGRANLVDPHEYER
jgi:hypothetical protein